MLITPTGLGLIDQGYPVDLTLSRPLQVEAYTSHSLLEPLDLLQHQGSLTGTDIQLSTIIPSLTCNLDYAITALDPALSTLSTPRVYNSWRLADLSASDVEDLWSMASHVIVLRGSQSLPPVVEPLIEKLRLRDVCLISGTSAPILNFS